MAERPERQPVTAPQLRAAAGLLTLSVLPHVWHLPAAVVIAFFLLASLRLLVWRDPARVPATALRLLLVLLALALVVQQAGLTESRRFGVALLVVMAGLKLLELKARRDLFLVAFLGFFLLATQFLFSSAMGLTFWVLLVSAGWIAFLVAANQAGVALRAVWRMTATLLLGALPVMLLLFFLFPRLEGPLWSLQLQGASGITSFSDRLEMGAIAHLSQSEAVAFRVRFAGEPPAADQRYWRGVVLWHTDGKRWTRRKAPPVKLPATLPAGAIAYQVTMEPSNQSWLFPLDRVVGADESLLLDADGTLTSPRPLRERFSYRAASITPPRSRPLEARDRALGLQLPPAISPRLRALARRLRRAGGSDAGVVRRTLAFFHDQPFVYTLHPPVLGENPVDRFLFETRKGFCEHYAASFTLLMRLAGIPARVVVGYQGGEINPLGGHLVVRQSDAHAWSEVWLSGQGWTRVDPTAAVAPERVESGIAPLPAREGEPARFRVEVDAGLLRRAARLLGWYGDELQFLWHRWVVGYDRQRQRDLLQRLGLAQLEGYRLAVTAVLGALAAGVLLFLLHSLLGRGRQDPQVSAWRRFRRKLQRAGLRLSPATGPLDTGAAAMARFPHRALELQRIVHLYVRLRYGEKGSTDTLRELRRRIRRLRL